MLDGGGRVAADRVPVACRGLGAKPAEDLLLCLRRPQVALGLVGRRGNPQVGKEPQDVGLAVAQAFQDEPARLLPGLRTGNAADLLQPDEDRGAEQPQVSGVVFVRDGGQFLAAGGVRGVDESAESVRGLTRPERVRVLLGGILQIAQDMRLMKNSS